MAVTEGLFVKLSDGLYGTAQSIFKLTTVSCDAEENADFECAPQSLVRFVTMCIAGSLIHMCTIMQKRFFFSRFIMDFGEVLFLVVIIIEVDWGGGQI